MLRRLPAFILFLLVAGFLAWWIVRSAAVNTLARGHPLAAARVARDDPRVVAGLVAFDVRTRMGLVAAFVG